MPCCDVFEQTVDHQFTNQKATDELNRYRRKGAGPTTSRLINAISRVGVKEASLLDVGAGVGSLTFELLERGVDRAMVVEASAGYAAAATEEAARRHRTDQIEFVRGDFLAVASIVPKASIVTLDRVICCYPLYEHLLNEALQHCERVFALSYPRDLWYVRAGMRLENRLRRRKNGFQTFVHPAARMRGLIASAGFELVSEQKTLIWSADVFVRRTSVRPT